MRGMVILIVISFVILTMSFSLVLAAESSSSIVEADILAPVVQVFVPPHILFGNVTPGFSSEKVKVDIENVGTTAVVVAPELAEHDGIFDHLVFARRAADAFVPLGAFSLNIDRPTTLGGVQKEFFYAKLDLREYHEKVEHDMPGYRSTLVFWIVPQ